MKIEISSSIVSTSKDVMSGVPVFSGTRVPVSALFENLKDGASIDDFLEWFPGVTREQVVGLMDEEISSLLANAEV